MTTPSVIKAYEKKFSSLWRKAPTLDIDFRAFILKVEKQAYQRGLKDGYQKYIDEDIKAQDKLLRGFGLPLESQQAIKKFYKGDKHD